MNVRTSEQINEIAAASAKAQAELENIEKSGVNPAFRSSYAKLGTVLEEVRGKFAKHGIAIWQFAVNGEGSNVGVVTRLAHSSGQWIESEFYVAPAKFDAQGAGSAITYCRRYSLMAMAGVAPDDDDGNAAVARPSAPAPRASAAANARDSAGADPFSDDAGGATRPAGDRPAAPPSSPRPNGKAAPAPDADDPERKTKHDRAVAARDRIRVAVEAAQEPVIVEEILRINRSDLEFLLAYHEPSYDRLLELASARSQELRASA
ncbi:MAG TPA: ERF family protein [Casimicrobiaceae bacterium]|jgi:hypothetical protein